MIDLERVGKNLRALREKMGLSQRHVAAYLNVDQSLVSKFESGERAISTDALEKLSALYCSPVEQLLSDVRSDLVIAFRADSINEEDLAVLSIVNRVALNQRMLDQLVKERLNA